MQAVEHLTFVAPARSWGETRPDKLNPDEDWSRELRAWSPERRQEQAERRAAAEKLMKAKEEAGENESVRSSSATPMEQSLPVSPAAGEAPAGDLEDACFSQTEDLVEEAGDRTMTSIDASSLPVSTATGKAPARDLGDMCFGQIYASSLPVSPAAGEVLATDLEDMCRSEAEEPAKDASSPPVNLAIREVPARDLEDMCLSELEDDFAAEVCDGTSRARSRPEDEVASLLEQLAAVAERFDAGDYWRIKDGRWDLEALREDVKELALFTPEKQPADASPHFAPSPRYPIFDRRRPQRLDFSLPTGICA